MYVPEHFRIEDQNQITALIKDNSFGVLTSTDSNGGLIASHLPFMYDPDRGENGTLIAHMARANPHWQEFAGGQETLAVFQGPHAYISPNHYVSEGQVPTWNYVAIHAYGRVRIIDDFPAVKKIMNELIETQEATFETPWRYDAPDEVYQKITRGIVVFEIPVERFDAKAKLGQNKPLADRQGSIYGLRSEGGENAAAIADLTEKVTL